LEGFEPVFARQSRPRFVHSLEEFRLVGEGPASGHLLRPFFGAAAIEQSPHGSLMWKAIESFEQFCAIRRDV